MHAPAPAFIGGGLAAAAIADAVDLGDLAVEFERVAGTSQTHTPSLATSAASISWSRAAASSASCLRCRLMSMAM
jgi:hypothetical protein